MPGKPSKTVNSGRKSNVFRAISRLFRASKNYYEGAVRWSKERSWLPEAQPQDARFDVNEAELTEMIRKCRYFAKNVPLCDRLSDIFEQYTVGEGIEMVPATSSPEFNIAVRESWLEWCESPDATSNKSYADLQGEGANSLLPDGNYLIVKSFETVPSRNGIPGKQPRVQVVEIHRLRSPDNSDGYTQKGIKLNAYGKPIGYWIQNGLDTSRLDYYDAKDVIHVFKSKRPGQPFGTPILSSAINKLHDLDDLGLLQMRKAKQNARVANAVTKEAGEMQDDDDMLRQVETSDTQASDGTATTKDRITGYQKATGGEWIILKPGEEITQLKNESPSVAEQWFWQKIEAEVCATAGISRLLVFPESMQGTVVRADLEISAATLRGWSKLQARAWVQVYLWWLEWAIQNDPRLKTGKPTDYKRVEYRCPRGPNVDVGWNSQSVIAELDAGIRTLAGTYSELSQDWMREIRQRAIERRYVKDLATEFDLEEGEIVKLPDAVLKLMATEKASEARQSFESGGGNVPASSNAED